MRVKTWLLKLTLAAAGAVFAFATPSQAQAGDEWGRYYHWPYGNTHQYLWTPYEYQQTHDGGRYRYPVQERRFPTPEGWRNWSLVRKSYYRGHHFILDQF